MSDIPPSLYDEVVLLRKWAKQTATDPDSGEEVPLFNPRTQAWAEHFRWGVRGLSR